MRRLIPFAAAALMSCVLASADAQENPERVRQREALEQAAQARATQAAIQAAEQAELLASLGPPPNRFDLEFPGGTLAEYVAAIRGRNPAANIVLTGEFTVAAAPQVSLKSVTTEAAIGLLTSGAQDAPGMTYWVHSRKVDNAGSPEPVLVIEVRTVNRDARRPPQAPSESAVVSLAHLLRSGGGKPLRVEDVLSAVEAASSMIGTDPPTIRFHAETKLLIFRGSKEQVSMLRETLAALERSAAALE